MRTENLIKGARHSLPLHFESLTSIGLIKKKKKLSNFLPHVSGWLVFISDATQICHHQIRD
jgi:hypothetical protein